MKKEITINELLNRIVSELNKNSDKKYVINCFNYNNLYEWYGTHQDDPIDSEYKQEKFIAITTENYDTKDMFCGYLNYPEENEEFYSKGEFILCYKNVDDFDERLNDKIEINDLEYILHWFYGLSDEFKNKILNIYNHTKTYVKKLEFDRYIR